MTTELVSSTTDDTLAEIEQALASGGTCTPEQAMVLLRAVKPEPAPVRLPDGWATIQRGQVADLSLSKPRGPGDSGWPYYQRQGFSAPQPIYVGFPEVSGRIAKGLLERRRQVAQEGFTAEHDDMYQDGQLLRAAASYLLKAAGIATLRLLPFWPWKRDWFKDSDSERCLEKGFALLCAEMDRRDRSESPTKSLPVE